MTLPKIGESLDPTQTLAAQAKSKKKKGDSLICSNCKTVPYPRGFFPKDGTCWWCHEDRSYLK